MKVAVPLLQQELRLGHFASSQTVCSFSAAVVVSEKVLAWLPASGRRVLNQGGRGDRLERVSEVDMTFSQKLVTNE
jgi:hypothetical protein